MRNTPVGDIFYHDNTCGKVDWDLDRFLDFYVDDETFEREPVLVVEVKDIVPTQQYVHQHNIDSVSEVGNDTGAYLVLSKGLYYVIDGHHRISSEIRRGAATITAFVYKL